MLNDATNITSGHNWYRGPGIYIGLIDSSVIYIVNAPRLHKGEMIRYDFSYPQIGPIDDHYDIRRSIYIEKVSRLCYKLLKAQWILWRIGKVNG